MYDTKEHDFADYGRVLSLARSAKPGKESKYRGEGGWCVLVDGEDLLKNREEVSAGEEGKSRL